MKNKLLSNVVTEMSKGNHNSASEQFSKYITEKARSIISENIGTQEYSVTDIHKLGRFISNEIGVDYQTDSDTPDRSGNVGTVTVWELEPSEHDMIKNFISKNNLWTK